MTLAEIPMILILAGLAAYIVLAGADFGSGIWELTARGRDRERIRDHCHRAMAPVWEANHVWLIFVLVVCWTAYPEAFGSIFSTLGAALLLASLGIILRGAGYVVRSVSDSRWGSTLFSVSSIVTPFALGAAIGGVASERVPVGNAEGDLISSWINPTSLLIGVLAVVFCAYMAAVYLAADAARAGSPDLVRAFRARALGAGLAAGALALGGLGVLAADAESLYDGLTEGAGLVAIGGSAIAGCATLAARRPPAFRARPLLRRGGGGGDRRRLGDSPIAGDPPRAHRRRGSGGGRDPDRVARRHRRRAADPAPFAGAAVRAHPRRPLRPGRGGRRAPC